MHLAIVTRAQLFILGITHLWDFLHSHSFNPLCVSDNVFILFKPVVVATISECWEIVFDADTIVGEMQTESLEPVVSMFIGRDDGR